MCMGKSYTGVMCVCVGQKKKKSPNKHPSNGRVTHIVCGVHAANPICPVCGPRTGRFPRTMGTARLRLGGTKK